MTVMILRAIFSAADTPRATSASSMPFTRATKPDCGGRGFLARFQNSKPSCCAARSIPFVISPAQMRSRIGTPSSADARSGEPSSKLRQRMNFSQADGPLIMLSGFTLEPILAAVSSSPASRRPSVNTYSASPHSRTVSSSASRTIARISLSAGR